MAHRYVLMLSGQMSHSESTLIQHRRDQLGNPMGFENMWRKPSLWIWKMDERKLLFDYCKKKICTFKTLLSLQLRKLRQIHTEGQSKTHWSGSTKDYYAEGRNVHTLISQQRTEGEDVPRINGSSRHKKPDWPWGLKEFRTFEIEFCVKFKNCCW